MEKRCRVIVDRTQDRKYPVQTGLRIKLFIESEQVWRKGTVKKTTGQTRTEE
jgi:hypothetical protein